MFNLLRYLLLRFKLFAVDYLNVIFLLILILSINNYKSIWIPLLKNTKTIWMCSFLKKEALIKSLTSKIITHCNFSLFYCLVMLYLYFCICTKILTFQKQLKIFAISLYVIKLWIRFLFLVLLIKTEYFIAIFSWNTITIEKMKFTKSGNEMKKNLKWKIRVTTRTCCQEVKDKVMLNVIQLIFFTINKRIKRTKITSKDLKKYPYKSFRKSWTKNKYKILVSWFFL